MLSYLRSMRAVIPWVLAVALLPAAASATHEGTEPEKWPAYYDGQVVSVMMGPGGNSANPHQIPHPCFGLGPDFSGTSRAADVPLLYIVMVPGATQMSCPDGSGMHDMVLTAVPGDPGYNPVVQLVVCNPGPNFTAAAMPYTSASAVEAAINAGQLRCRTLQHIRFSQVVGP